LTKLFENKSWMIVLFTTFLLSTLAMFIAFEQCVLLCGKDLKL